MNKIEQLILYFEKLYSTYLRLYRILKKEQKCLIKNKFIDYDELLNKKILYSDVIQRVERELSNFVKENFSEKENFSLALVTSDIKDDFTKKRIITLKEKLIIIMKKIKKESFINQKLVEERVMLLESTLKSWYQENEKIYLKNGGVRSINKIGILDRKV